MAGADCRNCRGKGRTPVFPLTIFLAKLLGLYLIAVASAMAVNKTAMVATVDEIMRNRPLLMLSAILALSVGLALVVGHNVWTGGALPVFVTLIGWASLLKGLVFLLLPSQLSLRYYAALHYEKFFYVYAFATLSMGFWLFLEGFYA
jgi:hypothetical protein